MPAHIKRLKTNLQKIQEQEYEQLRLVLAQYPQLNEQKVTSLLWDAKKKANLQELNTWTFIMISPEQNRSVVRWLNKNSKRRFEATEVWALLFENVQRETGQIMLTRQEIAKEIEIAARHVSTIMTELESIGAIIKKKEGRGVIYYMNPNVANHYPQEIRNQKQKEAPQLKLLDGGLKQPN